jgi:recombinational DNA repair protein RecR
MGGLARPDWTGTMALVFSPSVENLIAQLTRLPGIGQRTAQRLAFHIHRGEGARAVLP